MTDHSDGPPNGRTYHFTTEGGDVASTVVEAVSFVTGRDPLAISPLADVVDPDALCALVGRGDEVTVTFEVEGVAVRVEDSGDVVVGAPEPADEGRGRLGDGSNVLVRAGERRDEACRDLLAAATPDGANVLGISFSPPIEDRLETWGSATGASPANAAVIAVGDFVRSAAAEATVPSRHWGAIPIESVPRSDDLAELDARIEAQLTAWQDSGTRTVVCFDSVTDLLRGIDPEAARRLLRSLTERMRAAGAVAHYHLDADAHDGTTGVDLADLYDVVVEVDDRGEWHVDF